MFARIHIGINPTPILSIFWNYNFCVPSEFHTNESDHPTWIQFKSVHLGIQFEWSQGKFDRHRFSPFQSVRELRFVYRWTWSKFDEHLKTDSIRESDRNSVQHEFKAQFRSVRIRSSASNSIRMNPRSIRPMSPVSFNPK